MCGFGAKIILDGRTMTEFRHSNNGQAGREVGGESCVNNHNKYLIK